MPASFSSGGTCTYKVRCPSETSESKRLCSPVRQGQDPSFRSSVCNWSLLPPAGGAPGLDCEKSSRTKGPGRSEEQTLSQNLLRTDSVTESAFRRRSGQYVSSHMPFSKMALPPFNLGWPREIYATWRRLAASGKLVLQRRPPGNLFLRNPLLCCNKPELCGQGTCRCSSQQHQCGAHLYSRPSPLPSPGPGMSAKKPPEDSNSRSLKSSHQNPWPLWSKDKPDSWSWLNS